MPHLIGHKVELSGDQVRLILTMGEPEPGSETHTIELQTDQPHATALARDLLWFAMSKWTRIMLCVGLLIVIALWLLRWM